MKNAHLCANVENRPLLFIRLISWLKTESLCRTNTEFLNTYKKNSVCSFPYWLSVLSAASLHLLSQQSSLYPSPVIQGRRVTAGSRARTQRPALTVLTYQSQGATNKHSRPHSDKTSQLKLARLALKMEEWRGTCGERTQGRQAGGKQIQICMETT